MFMESRPEAMDPRVERFWDNYLECLRLFRVPGKALPWYRRHGQAFINDFPDTRLLAQRPEHVWHWFERLGRNGQLSDWQYRQRVDALRLLFCHFLKAPWSASLDWEH